VTRRQLKQGHHFAEGGDYKKGRQFFQENKGDTDTVSCCPG